MKTTSQKSDSRLLFHCLLHVDKHESRKNRKMIMKGRNGQRFIGSTNSSSKHQKQLIADIYREMGNHLGPFPIKQKVHLKAVFWYPNTKAGKRWKRVIDLSNLLQGPEDALTSVGVIQDDSLICSYDGSRRLFGAPRFMLDLYVYEFKEDDEWT